MEKPGYLGDRLVCENIITQEQLEEALKTQKERAKNGEKVHLGKVLTELGYCSDEEIAKVLAEKHEVPYLEVDQVEITEEVLKLIPQQTANRYKVFPVKLEGNKLMVAMMNPQDIMTIDDLRVITGKEIQPVFIKDSNLEDLINKVSTKYNVNVDNYEFLKRMDNKSKQTKSQPNVTFTSSPGTYTKITPETSAVEILNNIVNIAVQEKSTDVHIEPFEDEVQVRFRTDGTLRKKMNIPMQNLESLVTRIKVLAEMDIIDSRIPNDGNISIEHQGNIIDIRVSTLPSLFGERVTLRFLLHDPSLSDLNHLGLKEEQAVKLKEIINHPYGFILVTGPAGSGKTTTLYTALMELNMENNNIITLEDPIERPIKGINQIKCNKSAGFTFSYGLRSMLRNHPDVIMVGDIRDSETGKMVTEASLTGHLVMSTLHTNDTAEAIVRLLDIGVQPYLLESSLTAILSQRLLRKLCNYCKVNYSVPNEELLKMLPGFPVTQENSTTELSRTSGCPLCESTGYRGLTGIFELMMITDSIRTAIKDKNSSREIKKIAQNEGMVTLREHAFDKIKDGITSIEEFQRVFV